MTRIIVGATALCAAFALPASAGHNNPWAGSDDVLLEQFHDANQEKSADTPGEDETRGVLVQSARGKR